MNKININRENLSGSEIEKFKNFKELESKYIHIQSNPLLKNIWFKTALYSAIVGTVCIGVWHVMLRNNPEKFKEKIAFINPPLPQFDIPYKSLLYNTERDSVIQVTTTTTIELRKNTMVDSTGNSIKGVAEIRYREFMDPAEIFLSGIPMNYDSAGKKTTFQSAGMININAFQNNKSLYIARGKTIKVSFVSQKTEKDYNLYYLDTIRKNWVYKGKDKIEKKTGNKTYTSSKAGNLNDSLKSIRAKIAGLRKPVIPAMADPKKWHFKIDILTEEFPELAGYSNTVFEIDETYKPLNPAQAKIDWSNVSLEKAQKPLYYFVTFSKDSLKCKYLVHPVLSGNSYRAELSNYEKKFQIYQQELAKRKQQELQLSQKLISPKTDKTRESVSYLKDTALYGIWSTEEQVTRSFEVSNFGYWNCDKPYYYNRIIKKPSFKINNIQYINEVYLADYTHNMLQSIFPGQDIKYDDKAKNLLIMVTGKNKIAVFTSKDFSEIHSVSGKYVFQMQLLKTPFNKNEELIGLLKKEILY
jgi:hypothetical protein